MEGGNNLKQMLKKGVVFLASFAMTMPISLVGNLTAFAHGGGNHNPNAVNDSATVDEDSSVKINVLANDSDQDWDPISIANIAAPGHGTAVLSADKKIIYTPSTNWNGTDTFKYTITDGHGGSDTATVTVTVVPVNDTPNAIDDAVTIDEDTSVGIDVVANDIDVDGDTLTITDVTPATNGTAEITTFNTILYTPNANFNGTDTFTYTISDGNGGTDTATVNVTINAVNDAPNAVDDSAIVNEDGNVDINVLNNDTDVEEGILTVTDVTAPANGTAVINPDGTIKYTPNANFNGTDTFTYTIADSGEATDTANVEVTVLPVNDIPVANDDTAVTDEDNAVTINVLANDTDIDGDTLSVASASNPSHGKIIVNSDGTITYTPEANYNGADAFFYMMSDGNGGTDSAYVKINVKPVNDAPKANDSSITANENTAVNGTVTGSDIDGDGLTFALVTAPSHGKVVLNSNGSYTYTPNTDYIGNDTFTFVSNDGAINSQEATVTITVKEVKVLPVTGEDTPYALYVLGGLFVLAGAATLIIRKKKQD